MVTGDDDGDVEDGAMATTTMTTTMMAMARQATG